MIANSKRLSCAIAIVMALSVSLQAQNRIETRDALTHVIQRVDPPYPAEAAAAKVGGTVYADVTVRADGTVESVEVLGGSSLLNSTVISALKRWTFKPFLENGKPARIITLIEIPFPDPVRDEEKRIDAAYRSSAYECRKQLESSPRSSVGPCREAVANAGQLPPERNLERTEVISMLGQAFFVNQQYDDALAQFELALTTHRKKYPLDDVEAASLLELSGIVQFALKDFPKADESMSASVHAFEVAIERLPNFKTAYTTDLQGALRQYATMKRLLGDTAAADALNQKADKLAAVSPPDPPKPVAEVRKVDGVTLMGPGGAALTADDLRKIRALVPGGAPSVWLIIAQPEGRYGKLSWDLQVYLEPEYAESGLRIGRLLTLSTVLPSEGAYSAIKTWKLNMLTTRYGQSPLVGRDIRDVQGESDPNRPFEIVEFGSPPRFVFTPDEIRRTIQFLRANAVAASSNGSQPRLSTDIQPWAIQSIFRWSQTEVEIQLVNPLATRWQTIRLQITPDKLSILELR